MPISREPGDISETRAYYRRLSHEELVEKAVILDGLARAALQKRRAETAMAAKGRLHDEVTGVFNRRALREAYQTRSRHQKRQADQAKPDLVAMIDLDNFKQINDKHGHAVGDQALQSVAELIQSSVREDDMIGRFGGDEFMAFFYNATIEEGSKVAEKMRLYALRFSEVVGPERPVPTLSIGVAEIDYSLPFNEMFQQADAAMYQAKRAGRNQVHILRPGESF